MSKVYALTVGTLQFHPPSFPQRGLLEALRHLEGTEYRFECRSPRNSCQFDSSFDIVAKRQLVASGCREIAFAPLCPVSIDFDFVLDVNGDRIVFEIEKANKEKLLYDFLKMHVYLHHQEIAGAVLVVPVNWAHNGAVVDLFSLACERFDLCNAYGMADPSKAKRILIVGVPQLYQGQPIDKRTLQRMKKECRDYFNNLGGIQERDDSPRESSL